MPGHASQRAELIAAGRRLAENRLVTGAAGNLSVRAGQVVLVTAAGADLGRLDVDGAIVAVDLDGSVSDGAARPTSELALHLQIYRTTGADAVAHAHPPASIAVACTHDELPAVHYYTVLLGGPVRVAEYATYGTTELADAVSAALDGRTAALMRNHGSVAYGDDVQQACDRIELLEWLADVYCRSVAIGTPRILDATELAAVRAQLDAGTRAARLSR